jgi:hypothetical protein
MQSQSTFVQNNVASYKLLFVLAVVLSIILVFQFGLHFSIQNNTVVWQGSCSFKEWNHSGDFGMVVDCGDNREGTMVSSDLIRSYVTNPGRLTCVQSAIGNIMSCDNRPPAPE